MHISQWWHNNSDTPAEVQTIPGLWVGVALEGAMTEVLAFHRVVGGVAGEEGVQAALQTEDTAGGVGGEGGTVGSSKTS